jgi:hypothetical protein
MAAYARHGCSEKHGRSIPAFCASPSEQELRVRAHSADYDDAHDSQNCPGEDSTNGFGLGGRGTNLLKNVGMDNQCDCPRAKALKAKNDSSLVTEVALVVVALREIIAETSQ